MITIDAYIKELNDEIAQYYHYTLDPRHDFCEFEYLYDCAKSLEDFVLLLQKAKQAGYNFLTLENLKDVNFFS